MFRLKLVNNLRSLQGRHYSSKCGKNLVEFFGMKVFKYNNYVHCVLGFFALRSQS